MARYQENKADGLAKIGRERAKFAHDKQAERYQDLINKRLPPSPTTEELDALINDRKERVKAEQAQINAHIKDE